MTAPFLTQLRLPVVAAPMFLVSGPELVIEASRAGVLGSFPAPNCRTPEELERWLGAISDALAAPAAPRPWAVNLVTHSSNTNLAWQLALVEQFKPPVVITALGSPRPVIEAVKGYGGVVIADVVNIKLAQKAVAAGADGLACVSTGAGGHTGHLSPFAFVSAVREFFDGIVTLGGGIADGYGVAGAVAAGADLVYVGTRFLVTEESMAPEAYKQMIVEHGTDDLIVSNGITGTNASWLRPSLVANGLDPDNLVPPEQRSYTGDKGHKKWKDIWAAGQGISVINSVEPVAEVVELLARDYEAALDRVTSLRRLVTA